jgi:uncharacterized protein YpmB
MEKNYTKQIIIGSVIIALAIIGSVLGFQYMKQSSIEKQQMLDLNAKKVEQEKADTAEKTRKLMLDACLYDADDAYWSYMELNGTGKRNDEKGVWALQRFWDNGQERKDSAESKCFKQYSK